MALAVLVCPDFLSIKELMKVKETVTEEEEDIEKIGKGNGDEDI